MKTMPPLFASIIVIAWNNDTHLAVCLNKLFCQTRRDFEIILVDNGSKDGFTLDNVPSNHDVPLRIERLPFNLGFAAANNIGARLARGEWIVLLNADAYPEPDWLENLLKAEEENPEYNFFSSRQVQYISPHLLDGAGDEYHVSGLAQRRFYGFPKKDYGLQAEEVFGACAAAAMYRRDDFLRAGGFDESYFSYFEDVDLSFRLRLAGGRCLYVPDAVVHHVGSASTGKTSDFAYYHIHRNMVWTFFKNMPAPFLLIFLPFLFITTLRIAVSVLVKQRRLIIVKALWDALLGLPAILRTRQRVQSNRRVRLSDLYRIMGKTGIAKPVHR